MHASSTAEPKPRGENEMTRTLRISMGLLIAAGLFGAGYVVGQNEYRKPTTVIHVVSGKWKEGTPEEEKQKALAGVEQMAREIPGIRNIWLKPLRIQPREYNYLFVIEFADAKAAEVYATHPAHEKWNQHYQTIRQESRSLQATN
jgi:hypothetical protein